MVSGAGPGFLPSLLPFAVCGLRQVPPCSGNSQRSWLSGLLNEILCKQRLARVCCRIAVSGHRHTRWRLPALPTLSPSHDALGGLVSLCPPWAGPCLLPLRPPSAQQGASHLVLPTMHLVGSSPSVHPGQDHACSPAVPQLPNKELALHYAGSMENLLTVPDLPFPPDILPLQRKEPDATVYSFTHRASVT